MSRKRTISLLSVLLMLAFAAAMSLALGSSSLAALNAADATSPQASVGSGFTYQGRLTDGGGNPINDTCGLDFTLWDAETGGSMIGHQIVTGVAVDDGYLTVLLNGGDELGERPFDGQARWLKIAVKCSGDADWHILPGRQLLSATPYALSLQPGALISGTVAGKNALSIVNYGAGGNALGGYSHDADGVHGQSVDGAGVSAFSFNQVALYSESRNNTAGFFTSTHGFGVGANTTSDDPGVAALEAVNLGAGPGVVGYSNDMDGVYGHSVNGHGVEGVSVNEVAVYGQSENTAGYFTSTFSVGVHGSTTSGDPDVAAVEGLNLGAGPGVAGYGSDGPGGYFENQAGGTVLYAAGDVAQEATAAGLVKAAVFIGCSNLSVNSYRAFNTVSGFVVVGPTGNVGECWLDFSFDLSARFWTAMAYDDTSAATVSCTLDPGDNEVLLCKRWDSAGNPLSGDIMVLVY
jgi:hypothetical protein